MIVSRILAYCIIILLYRMLLFYHFIMNKIEKSYGELPNKIIEAPLDL